MKQNLNVGALCAAPGQKVQTYLPVEGTPVQMPITLINGEKEGKTVVITGGTHGGEYPGVEAAIRIASALTPAEVAGQLIIVHPVNVPQFTAKMQYVSPLDGKNLNREYPGAAMGTVSQRIAYTVSSLMFAQADFYMDLHGGDIHEDLVDFVLYPTAGGDEIAKISLECAKALGVKYVGASGSGNSSFGAASVMGVPGFLGEIGKLGVWNEDEVSRYIAGVYNVLKVLKVLEGEPCENPDAVLLSTMIGVNADKTGCWYPCVKPGEEVKEGQKVGEIRDYFGKTLGEYYSPSDGVMLYVIASLPINDGEPIFALGK